MNASLFYFLPFWILLVVPGLKGADLDRIVHDREQTFEYVLEVKKKLGKEAFGQVRARNVVAVARLLGRMERQAISPEIIIRHVARAEAMQEKSPYPAKLSRHLWESYLLPLRLRNEHLRNADWLNPLADAMVKMLGEEVLGPNERAEKVFGWIARKISILPEPDLSGMRLRGDLDPVTILKGHRARKSDLALFGVAALRAAGLAARLVFVPVNTQSNGEYLWVEYWDGERWITWVPDFRASIPLKEHAAKLQRVYERSFPLVLADPFLMEDVTERYFPRGKMVQLPGSHEAAPGSRSFCVVADGCLSPIVGRELAWKGRVETKRAWPIPSLIQTITASVAGNEGQRHSQARVTSLQLVKKEY